MDYDKLYATQSQDYFDWVARVAQWKADNLCRLIEREPTGSILEIGTGRGDVLHRCVPFKNKIGVDISEEALAQHRCSYPTHRLERIDANSPLPFKDDELDCVLLCDILEHVEDPVRLLRESARVAKNVLVKIPIERALVFRVVRRIQGVEYGPNHPSGHLHCWTLRDIRRIMDGAGLVVVRSRFAKVPFELLRKKTWPAKIFVRCLNMIDRAVRTPWCTRRLLGGAYFAILQKSPVPDARKASQ